MFTAYVRFVAKISCLNGMRIAFLLDKKLAQQIVHAAICIFTYLASSISDLQTKQTCIGSALIRVSTVLEIIRQHAMECSSVGYSQQL